MPMTFRSANYSREIEFYKSAPPPEPLKRLFRARLILSVNNFAE
jgi:hypothetical protein